MDSRRQKMLIRLAGIALVVAAISVIGNAGADAPVNHHGKFVQAGDSKSCIACHDGTIGPHARYCTRKCDITQGHVIFRHYPPRGKEREFVPAAVAEAKGIVFVKGQVTCVSCHNVRNPGRNHLAVDNKNSRLCLSCHIH